MKTRQRNYKPLAPKIIASPRRSPLKIQHAPANDQLKFKCLERKCEKTFLTKFLLKKHQKTPHKFKCEAPGCGRVYYQFRNLYTHKKVHKSKSNLLVQTYKCPEPSCEGIFFTYPDLREHIKTEHFKCGFNGCTRVYKYLKQLKKHEKAEHSTISVPSFKCPVRNCEEAFVTEILLKTHLKPPHKFKCNVNGCNRDYFEYKNLYMHKKTHYWTFKKPTLDCPELNCKEKFLTKQLVKSHQQTVHKFELKFQCTIRGCAKRFKFARHLCLHLKTSHPTIQENSNNNNIKVEPVLKIKTPLIKKMVKQDLPRESANKNKLSQQEKISESLSDDSVGVENNQSANTNDAESSVKTSMSEPIQENIQEKVPEENVLPKGNVLVDLLACVYCNQLFIKHDFLTQHLHTHSTKSLKCTQSNCDCVFEKYEELVHHLEAHKQHSSSNCVINEIIDEPRNKAQNSANIPPSFANEDNNAFEDLQPEIIQTETRKILLNFLNENLNVRNYSNIPVEPEAVWENPPVQQNYEINPGRITRTDIVAEKIIRNCRNEDVRVLEGQTEAPINIISVETPPLNLLLHSHLEKPNNLPILNLVRQLESNLHETQSNYDVIDQSASNLQAETAVQNYPTQRLSIEGTHIDSVCEENNEDSSLPPIVELLQPSTNENPDNIPPANPLRQQQQENPDNIPPANPLRQQQQENPDNIPPANPFRQQQQENRYEENDDNITLASVLKLLQSAANKNPDNNLLREILQKIHANDNDQSARINNSAENLEAINVEAGTTLPDQRLVEENVKIERENGQNTEIIENFENASLELSELTASENLDKNLQLNSIKQELEIELNEIQTIPETHAAEIETPIKTETDENNENASLEFSQLFLNENSIDIDLTNLFKNKQSFYKIFIKQEPKQIQLPENIPAENSPSDKPPTKKRKLSSKITPVKNSLLNYFNKRIKKEVFESTDELDQHTSDAPTGSRSSNNGFQCKRCERTFFTARLLYAHKCYNSTQNPFQCLTCSHTFADYKKLLEHKETHFNKFKGKKSIF